MAKKQQTIITPKKKLDLLSDVAPDWVQYEGRGVSQLPEDNLIPLIYILQPLSPAVLKKNAAYIDGAEPGMFLLRNSSEPLVDGDEGMLFQPCYYTHDWVEWVPRKRGGGLVTRHARPPDDAEMTEDEDNPNRKSWLRPNGNEIIETRTHYGYVLGRNSGPEPYCFPLTGTNHVVSRGWSTLMNKQKNREDGNIADSWSVAYRLTTDHRQNTQGEWYMLKVEKAGWLAQPEDYHRGKELMDAFVSGVKKAALPDEHSRLVIEDNSNGRM